MAGAKFVSVSSMSEMDICAQTNQDNSAGGKVNIPTEFLSYHGKNTDTAETIVNDEEKTISVNVLGSGKDSEGNIIVDTYASDVTLKQEGQNIVVDAVSESGKLLSHNELKFDLQKAKGLYLAEQGEFESHPEKGWYLTSEIFEDGSEGNPGEHGEYILSGPYDLGKGGGGGGGTTDLTISNIDPKTGISLWPTATTVGSETKIGVIWTSIKKGQPTGNGTLTVSVNGSVLSTKSYPQAAEEPIYFDISSAIVSGLNTVKVNVMDAYGNSDEIIGTINAVALSIESAFDYTIPLNSVRHNFTYITYGDVKKTIIFELDGVEVDRKQLDGKSGEEQTYRIPTAGLTHGAHTIAASMTAIIGGDLVTSNRIEFDFIYTVAGKTDPIIISAFKKLDQTQYIPMNIPFVVYDPTRLQSTIDLSVNGETISTITVDRQVEQVWNWKSDIPGTFELQISDQRGGEPKTFTVNVAESEIHIEPVQEGLALALSAQGRSNAEDPETRQIWRDAEHDKDCTLTDFNWASDGWLRDSEGNSMLRVSGDARVVINYQPFLQECKQTGKTIELELATSIVRDYETKLISCLDSDGKGFYVTPQLAKLKSQQIELQTQYKEDDHVRLAFVIERVNDKRIVYLYVNGIMSGAVQYVNTDSFRQQNPAFITIGSNDAVIDLYNVRVYDAALTRKQVVNNWIADTQDEVLKNARYRRNDNYNEKDELVIEKLPQDLPYMIWDMDPLPRDKKDNRPGTATYVNPMNRETNFVAENAQFKVQGTSSAGYPVKNIRIKYKQGKNSDGSKWPEKFVWYDYQGNVVDNPKFAITPGGIGDNYFTYKVDFASSEGANNVELTRLYNDTAKANSILVPPQKENSKIRIGIDGFPIVSFHKNKNGVVSFNSKVNFNNDKANEKVYGFSANLNDPDNWHEGEEWTGDESWETTNNSSDYATFHKAITKDTFEEAFEIRYPDIEAVDTGVAFNNISRLAEMSAWVVSTDRTQTTGNPLSEEVTYEGITYDADTAEYRLAKFRAEFADHFNVSSALFYYLFTHLFLMVDSRAKNAFPTYYYSRTPGDGGDRWFFIPYDMDTALGINNEGKLVFDYNLEDTDHLEGGADVFNGQSSTLWCNVRDAFQTEIGTMYEELRKTGILSFDHIEDEFEKHQNKWSESIFNEDSYVKYIKTLQGGDNYLEMLQGSKTEQRRWWLYNRFKYFDSKYTAGDALEDNIQFRAYVQEGQAKPDIVITPYADIYATVSYAKGRVVSERAKRGEPIVIKNPHGISEKENDQETYIYSASQLRSVGDLSGFYPDTVKVGKAIKLQDLKIGDGAADYVNTNLTSLELGNNTLLKTLDVRNCVNLTTPIDISGCVNIEEVYFNGTKITALILPVGGNLKKLHVPDTLTDLTIKNHRMLTDLQIVGPEGTKNLRKLCIENVPSSSLNPYEWITKMSEGSAVRLIGIDVELESASQIKAMFDNLDTMIGFDDYGEPDPTMPAQITGKIYIDKISYDDYMALKDRYAEVSIEANHIVCSVKFINEGEQYGDIQYVDLGKVATLPPTPEKESTQEFYYTFRRWDKDLSVISGNVETTAEYDAHLQRYLVEYDINAAEIKVDPEEAWVYYGHAIADDETEEYKTIPHIDESTIPYGVEFLGWYLVPAPGAEDESVDVESYVVEDNTKFYANWLDHEAPQFDFDECRAVDYKTYHFEADDNVGITGWALSRNGEEAPVDGWHPVSVTKHLAADCDSISGEGDWYIWVKDRSGKHSAAHIRAYAVTIEAKTGDESSEEGFAEINILSGDKQLSEETKFALEGVSLDVSCTLKEHYNSLEIKINGESTTHVDEIKDNINIKVACKPDTYTVTFDVGAYGDPVESQEVVYNHYATEPAPQYDYPQLLHHWCSDEELTEEFDFKTMPIERDMTLHASWIEYHDPTIMTIVTETENQSIDVTFEQQQPYSVEVNWINEDDEYYEVSGDGTGRYTMTHVYPEAGTHYVRIRSRLGQYRLGYNNFKHAIEPTSVLRGIEFAFDTPDTMTYAFEGCVNLTDIKLTRFMTNVGNGAFKNCTSLKTIEIGDNITVIGQEAFTGCTGLEGELRISDKIVEIGNMAFQGCTNVTSVILPEALETIGESAFRFCSKLAAINIPTKLMTLPKTMLQGCESLTEIDIPANIRNLGESLFTNCINLSHITLRSEHLDEVEQYCFSACPKLMSVGPIGSGANIEYGLTTLADRIPDNMFYESTLSEFDLPATIRSIGNNAFTGCRDMSDLDMSKFIKLESIGLEAFARTGLKAIFVPKTVLYIKDRAFANIPPLRAIQFDNMALSFKSTDPINTDDGAAYFRLSGDASLFKIIIPKGYASYTPETLDEELKRNYGFYWNSYDSTARYEYEINNN